MNHSPALRPENAGDELAWLAFRFIAGEMTADESRAFEARLADDQAAREAVAEAVELFHAVCAAEAAEPICVAAKAQTTWTQRIAWVASGAVAAAIVVLVGLNLGSLTRRLPSGNEPAIAAISPALADAWSAVRSDLTGGDEVAPERLVSTSDDLSDEGLNDEHVGSFASEFTDEQLTLATETPSWMTAAVLGLSTRDLKPLDAGESAPQEN
jgi:hypothetical protein